MLGVAALIALGAFLVYHFGVHHIHNDRPLGGPNVDVSRASSPGTQMSFAVDAGSPEQLLGVSGNLQEYASPDGGRIWHQGADLPVPDGTCTAGDPRTVVGRKGAAYAAYLVSSPCGGYLKQYLVTTSRPVGGHWAGPVRVAPAAWPYGYDDAPALAVDPRNDRLYVAWTRSLADEKAAVVVSSSVDAGKTWSAPKQVAAPADHPHAATVAVGPDGDLYVAGIDARHGVWIARSSDGGRSFGPVRTAAPLRANPAGGCALTGASAVPGESKSCAGPNPTVVVSGSRVLVVYADAGSNGTQDVLGSTFDSSLRPLFRTSVSPPDSGKSDQLFPTATVDATTGVVWACWYDTTFDPNRHRVWYTCSASRGGRSWTPAMRAASEPTMTSDIFTAVGTSGLSTSVTAAGGIAHAFWVDGRSVDVSDVIYTAALPERRAFALASES